MCMLYKGIDYHYAFEFKIPRENSSPDEYFHVVISNYREETHDYAGLCLENEYKVISSEKIPFLAFFEIIDQIIYAIIAEEKVSSEANQRQPLSPLMRVQSPVFLEQFEKCRKSKKSLDYYKKLKGFFERPETMPEKVFNKTSETALYDCQNLSFFSNLVSAETLPIKNIGFFRI